MYAYKLHVQIIIHAYIYMLACIIRRLCVYICWHVLYVGYACICWYVLYIYPMKMRVIRISLFWHVLINIICYHYSEQKKNFFTYRTRVFTVTSFDCTSFLFL